MYRAALLSLLAATLCGLLLTTSASAGPISFGSGLNQFSIDFVPIGSPGNVADTTGNPNPAGAVGYTYQIGTYEVSEDMINKANALGGLGISKDTRGTDKPATGVSWNEAARFVNWLNTSQGFQAAYKFALQPGDVGYSSNSNSLLWGTGDAGYDANNLFRNSLANYVLPSVDEWYKAAYYVPNANGGLGGYWNFPTGSDSAPTAVASGTAAGTAVYSQLSAQGPADITEAGGLSPFGVMGLGGNVWEWEETEFDLMNNNTSSNRGDRGGSWNNSYFVLSSSDRVDRSPTDESFTVSNIGFRVASLSPADVPEPSTYAMCPSCGTIVGAGPPADVPEPSTYAMVMTGLTVLGWFQWRRRGK